MKTINIVSAYRTINVAKLSKMEDADKYKVIKAIREMKPIAEQFDSFVSDARERLKPEDFDTMQEKAAQWQKDGDATTLTMEERIELNHHFEEYNEKVQECVREESEKEIELKFARLSEEAFCKLMASNPDWDVKTAVQVEEVLVEL